VVRFAAAPPRPTLRVGTAFRAGLAIVRFFAVGAALRARAAVPVVPVAVVLFDFPAVAVFA
jgi:hypothetical protein